MSLERLFFASNVLKNGNILVLGGEYTGPNTVQNFNNTGQIYNPVTNTWAGITAFPQAQFGDDPTMILPDGKILAGYISGPQTYIYDPAANTWTATGNKLRNDRSDEETWVKLPDGSVLSYDIFAGPNDGTGTAQRYVPSSGTWVDAGTVPVQLSSASVGFELGPAFLLPDGRAFFLGANGNTAYYTPATNSWTAGPAIPQQLGADDAPGAMLPNGHILFAADTPLFQGPTHVFEYNPATETYTDVTPSSSIIGLGGASFLDRMLVLPTGQIMLTNSTGGLALYTPDLAPQTAWKPTISSVVNNFDGTYTLTGTQLNGLSQGASYGDDAEMDSNYPIVRIVSSNGTVTYARTFNWSNTGVQTGSTPVSTSFTLPAGLAAGNYSVTVIANGIASDPKTVELGQTISSITISPSTVTVSNGHTQTFTATATDQFGAVISPPPAFTWSVVAGGVGGTINSAGTYTAPATGTGGDTVKATAGGVSATASVTVQLILTSGQSIFSPNGAYQLIMQSDGNLVEYGPSGTVWSSATGGHAGAQAIVQTDGNLVVYSASGQVLWQSYTGGHTGAYLVLKNDGVAALSQPSTGMTLFFATTQHALTSGQSILSPNGQYQLLMQSDGNLIEYGPSGAVWSSATGGHSGAQAIMQSDGNLVIYSATGQVLWASNTGGHTGAFLVLKNDGVAAISDPLTGMTLFFATTQHALTSGQSIFSPNGQYQLLMQSDGNLVEYGPSGLVWNSATGGHSGAQAIMQSDGNLVIYSATGQVLWASNTGGHTGAFLVLKNDGVATINDPFTGTTLFFATTQHALTSGQSILSPNGQYQLLMQSDGNLVEYGPSGLVWNSATGGHSGAQAIMQSDGNLVVYSATGQVLWASNTGGHTGAYLVLKNDGTLQIVYGGTVIWTA